jgi:hypothetical protein
MSVVSFFEDVHLRGVLVAVVYKKCPQERWELLGNDERVDAAT